VNDVQVRFLDTIRGSVDRMARLVADLSDLSRIEAGRLQLEVEGVDLGEVITDVTRLLDGQIKSKQQLLDVEVAADLPEIWGDRGRLNQIITNLLSNANKYTPDEGQIRIRAFQDQFTETGEPPRDVVHVSVQDNGVGIPESEQKYIFTKFFRASDQNARQQPGTGLGLNITQQLLEMHEGHVWFESEYGKGTTFHIVLPIPDMDRVSSSN
jgi:signal transduction histidine kinase